MGDFYKQSFLAADAALEMSYLQREWKKYFVAKFAEFLQQS